MEYSAQDVADWMLAKVKNAGILYQSDAVNHIVSHFGESYIYVNENGNTSISKEVKKIIQETPWRPGCLGSGRLLLGMDMKIIDLSVPLYTGMPVFPGDPEVRVAVVQTYETHAWELRQLILGSHTGTHVDAFSHMHAGLETLDEISLERFFWQGSGCRSPATGLAQRQRIVVYR